MSGGGALESSVTLEEVLVVLRAKRVPLAPELAGYLVLEIAEHADPSGGDVDPRSVFIGEEGTVALVKPRRDAPSGSAESSVRALLGHLLEASGSQTPALAAAGKRKSGGDLAELAEELLTALIPVNRAAGRRALARLAREVRRVTLGVGRNALPSSSDASGMQRRTSGAPALEPASDPAARPAASQEGPPATSRSASSDPGIAPSQRASSGARPPEPPARATAQPGTDVDSLIERFGGGTAGPQYHSRELKALAGLDPTPPPAIAGLPRADARSTSEIGASQSGDDEASDEGARLAPAPPLDAGISSADPARFGSARLVRFALLAGAVLAATAGYAALRSRRSPIARALSDLPTAPSPSAAAPPAAPPRAGAECRGVLVVSNAPPSAEVLLREGQAPIEMERMPVGARLEFVATAEGYVPKRVVVPAAARWTTGLDGKPRFEETVQLEKSKTGDDPWPAGEPGRETGGRGPPGTVRLVSTPRGAEIWLLAGIGPEARVDGLRCDRDWDVLVAGPATFRRRMRVFPADFRAERPAGSPVARLSVK